VGGRQDPYRLQSAFDAECAALARVLETATKGRVVPEQVTVFTDAQAAIERMTNEDGRAGPGRRRAIRGT